MIAGGIGLAPLRGVVYELVRRRDDFGEAALLYGSRTPAELLYPKELERWRRTLQVDVTVDAADPGWEGKVGVVAKLVGSARFDPARRDGACLRPGDHDADERAGAARARRRRRSGSTSRWSATCSAASAYCGHCQLGPTLICRDGPVYR